MERNDGEPTVGLIVGVGLLRSDALVVNDVLHRRWHVA